MKRTLLSILSIFTLVLAWSVCSAQTDSGSTPPAVESGVQTGSDTGQPMNDTGTPSAPTEGSMPAPSSADTASTHESLPATASHVPLAFAIGLSALGAAAALRAYRRRGSF